MDLKVEIREVGMRDGLQSIADIMPTEVKLAWLDAEYAAGVRAIEVSSFVPPKLLPQLADAEADGIILADTVGYGQPAAIGRVFRRVIADVAPLPVAAHFHDTRGLGLANVLAAYAAGCTRFDASLGGLGGCPYAPGATGNIVFEDTVFMFEAMGVATGIDLERLAGVRGLLAAALPHVPLYGAIAKAGLPRNFHPVAGAA